MLLMIDNYDSFTYNVVQYLSELKADVKVIRNDEYSIEEVVALNPERSPLPLCRRAGHPCRCPVGSATALGRRPPPDAGRCP